MEDSQIVRRIIKTLDGQRWDASACREIVGILVDAGYRVRAPSLEPHVDRHGEELPT